MGDFIKGLQLNENFYREIVAEILQSNFPNLEYSAGLIGWGSEILGYDDELSADHNWGLRFQIFLSPESYQKFSSEINRVLAENLPEEFQSYPVNFRIHVNKDQRDPEKAKNAGHNIEIETIEGFFRRYLGCDPFKEITVADWLTFPEHKLLGVTSGKVFYDGLNKLEKVREEFKYYPQDIWLYMLSAQWQKIFAEQAFIGRCGFAGDELGSRLLAAKQIKNLMRLCFLIEQKYAPYNKWFGKAFSGLDCAGELAPVFTTTLEANDWKTGEKHFAEAYKEIIRRFNKLNITDPMSEEISRYFGRPFLVIKDESIVEKLKQKISDRRIMDINHDLGSVNQFFDSSDKLNDVSLTEKFKEFYK